MKTKLKVLTMLACSALGSTACSERVNAMTEAEGNPVEVSAINPTSDFSIQYTTDVPVAFLVALLIGCGSICPLSQRGKMGQYTVKIGASCEDIRAALPVTLGAQNWQAHKAMVPADGLKTLSLK